MIKVVDNETTEEFMKRLNIRPAEESLKCLSCGEPAIFNEHGFISGMAFVRFKHGCEEKYWISKLIPFSDKEKKFWRDATKEI